MVVHVYYANYSVCMNFFFSCYGYHRDLHVLTHSFPTRRSSDLECLRVFDLARESRALARGSLFQLAGFSLARSLSLSSSSEANMSSALSNRARPLAFICATSSIAAREIGRAHV